jgi:hypothetical protein
MNDPEHCGDCDTKCEGGTSCVSGMCKCGNVGETYCDGMCVKTTSDPMNCGACGKVCDGSQKCCLGMCIDPMTDKDNCGVCGMTCGTGLCCDGTCENACGSCGNVCSGNTPCCCKDGKCYGGVFGGSSACDSNC